MCSIRAFPAYIHAVTDEKSHSRTPFETALLGKNRSDQDVQGHLNCTGARARAGAGAGVGGYRASGRVHGKPAQPWGRSLVLHRWRGTAHLPCTPASKTGREVQGHPPLHGEFEGSWHPKFILKSIFHDFCEHREVLSAFLRRLFCRNKQGLWVSDGSCSV